MLLTWVALWPGAVALNRAVQLPRALRGRTRTIVGAGGDDVLSPYDGYEEEMKKKRVSRLDATKLKGLLEAEDFDGADLESAALLDGVLPELADVARMRGRALLNPLLDRMIAGESPAQAEYEGAYEAFRLSAFMNPDDCDEAREKLALIKKLAATAGGGDDDDGGGAIETTGETVEEKALRFSIGARVECNTGRTEGGWEGGEVVGLYHREGHWPPGEFVPYQVRLDDGTLIYAPKDVDGCVRLRSREGLDADVVVVGAGASGVGCAVALTRAFGLDPSRVRLLERGDAIGESFRLWPEEMRFISPSFNQQGWTNSFDLNAVAQDTSPAYALHAQHPSGAQYATYLEELARDANLDVRLGTEVATIDRRDDGDFDVRVVAASGGDAETVRARFVVWAAGEFQYPREAASSLPGAEHCVHNSKVRSWANLEGDERVIIGGYESGVDAAYNLAKAGKRATVLAATATWNVQTPDPSTELAPYTAERLREVTHAAFPTPPTLMSPLRVLRVEEASSGGFDVVAEWQEAPPPPERSLRTPVAAGAPPGEPGTEVVVHTAQPPVLATGFEGSVASVGRDLFDLADGANATGCLAGAPLLTAEDESTKVPGVFLVGPSVVQGDLSFCFIYKFRQRFGIVADAICRGLGRDTKAAVQSLRQANMYMGDLSCCENTCGEVC